jgi:hypothetical protein
VKGSEKFKRGMAEGSLFEIRLIQMSLRKGKRKRERESEISFKAKFDRGWNTGEMEQQFLHHCAERNWEC